MTILKRKRTIIRWLILPVIFIIIIATCSNCKQQLVNYNYEVSVKDSANFSIDGPELQPQERLVVMLEKYVIFDKTGKSVTGNHSFWKYYSYPNEIKSITVRDYFKGELKIEKVFKDTLLNIPQRSIIISRAFPKGVKRENWSRYGFVSMDTATRSVLLVDDSEYYKGTWRDK
jgi:hypothetical protein